jgi:fibro-slime domain-containing protein
MKTRTPGSIGLLALLLAEGAGCVGEVNVQVAPGSDAAAGQSGNASGAAGNGGAPGTGGAMAGGGSGGSGAIPGAGGAGAAAGFTGTGGAAGTDASVGAGGASGSPFQMVGGAAGFVTPDGGGGSGYPDSAIPPGIVFVQAEIGAYAPGAAITGAGIANTGVTVKDQACNVIAGVVRDFKDSKEGGHPDFEAFVGTTETVGLVQTTLDANGKPVYTGVCEAAGITAACPFSQQTSSKATFDQWYRFTEGVNKPFIVYLAFTPVGGMMSFQSNNFFPLDGAGWGNNHTRGDGPRNFAFTTEIHTTFRYAGGETFTFIGDDDVWVFVNGKLAMDLGGVHQKTTYTINLDQTASALGITPGTEYALDLFHAERHTWDSNFRIDTNLAFTNCGTSIPPDFR